MTTPFGRGAVERLPEQRQLVGPSDERRVEPARVCRRALHHAKQAVRGDGIALSLEIERVDAPDLDGVSAEAERLLADQDLPRRGRLLQTRRHVHRISRHDRLIACAGHDLAGVHPDPAGQRHPMVTAELVVQGPQSFAHLGGGADRP